eukprot:08185.XXX_319984_320211_1 [CDS] Oithona nana genome sequencing.
MHLCHGAIINIVAFTIDIVDSNPRTLISIGFTVQYVNKSSDKIICHLVPWFEKSGIGDKLLATFDCFCCVGLFIH